MLEASGCPVSLKSFIASRVTAQLTSAERLARRRSKAEAARQKEGRRQMIEYFHDASDPYSHLVTQILGRFRSRYDVDITPHLVPPPPDWAAPNRQKLIDWSRRDAELLAKEAGLLFTDTGSQPDAERLAQVQSALASAIEAGRFIEEAPEIGAWLWSGNGSLPPAKTDPAPLLAEGAARRESLGHYLAGTLFYEGEWYWGVDRLHYLERRLQSLETTKNVSDTGLIYAPPALLSDPPAAPKANGPELHYYLSFRSPYTYIAAERVKALADAYGATLKLRFVLPMVMRGMQVPRMKGLYILKDTAREAQRLGIPFGKVADPVGEPVERGYAILPMAIEQDKGFDFALSFLRGVWAEGIDAGSDKGLRQITERAGLDWSAAKDLIGGDHWKAEAEANRTEMMSLGLWGVPSFRVGDTAVWGQDRLWVIEKVLRQDC